MRADLSTIERMEHLAPEAGQLESHWPERSHFLLPALASASIILSVNVVSTNGTTIGSFQFPKQFVPNSPEGLMAAIDPTSFDRKHTMRPEESVYTVFNFIVAVRGYGKELEAHDEYLRNQLVAIRDTLRTADGGVAIEFNDLKSGGLRRCRSQNAIEQGANAPCIP